MNTEVRPATADDHDAILRVVEEAFADDTRDASEELDIVRHTWARRSGTN